MREEVKSNKMDKCIIIWSDNWQTHILTLLFNIWECKRLRKSLTLTKNLFRHDKWIVSPYLSFVNFENNFFILFFKQKSIIPSY